jgi:hypothetical protein
MKFLGVQGGRKNETDKFLDALKRINVPIKFSIEVRSVLAIKVEIYKRLQPIPSRKKIVLALNYLFCRPPTDEEVSEWQNIFQSAKTRKQFVQAFRQVPQTSSWINPILQEVPKFAEQSLDLLVIRDLFTCGDVAAIQANNGCVISFNSNNSDPKPDFVIATQPKSWDAVAREIMVRMAFIEETKTSEEKKSVTIIGHNWMNDGVPWVLHEEEKPQTTISGKLKRMVAKRFEMWW